MEVAIELQLEDVKVLAYLFILQRFSQVSLINSMSFATIDEFLLDTDDSFIFSGPNVKDLLARQRKSSNLLKLFEQTGKKLYICNTCNIYSFSSTAKCSKNHDLTNWYKFEIVDQVL